MSTTMYGFPLLPCEEKKWDGKPISELCIGDAAYGILSGLNFDCPTCRLQAEELVLGCLKRYFIHYEITLADTYFSDSEEWYLLSAPYGSLVAMSTTGAISNIVIVNRKDMAHISNMFNYWTMTHGVTPKDARTGRLYERFGFIVAANREDKMIRWSKKPYAVAQHCGESILAICEETGFTMWEVSKRRHHICSTLSSNQ